MYYSGIKQEYNEDALPVCSRCGKLFSMFFSVQCEQCSEKENFQKSDYMIARIAKRKIEPVEIDYFL